MTKRRRRVLAGAKVFRPGGAAQIRKMRKEASKLSRQILRALRSGDCVAAKVPMRQLDRLNATIPQYTIKFLTADVYAPNLSSLMRIRRAYATRCKVG